MAGGGGVLRSELTREVGYGGGSHAECRVEYLMDANRAAASMEDVQRLITRWAAPAEPPPGGYVQTATAGTVTLDTSGLKALKRAGTTFDHNPACPLCETPVPENRARELAAQLQFWLDERRPPEDGPPPPNLADARRQVYAEMSKGAPDISAAFAVAYGIAAHLNSDQRDGLVTSMTQFLRDLYRMAGGDEDNGRLAERTASAAQRERRRRAPRRPRSSS